MSYWDVLGRILVTSLLVALLAAAMYGGYQVVKLTWLDPRRARAEKRERVARMARIIARQHGASAEAFAWDSRRRDDAEFWEQVSDALPMARLEGAAEREVGS